MSRAAETGPGGPAGLQGWAWLAGPALLAALGAVALARDHGLWYDEVYTAEMARVPPGGLVRAFVSGEGTIPYLRDAPPSYNAPYYLAVHAWLAVTRLGPGEIPLRVLSLLAAVGAVALLARASARLAGPPAGVATGLLAAANPLVVQYAVEARGYALALLATSASAVGLARWLDGGRRTSLALFGAAGSAAGLLHWYSLLVTAGLALAAVLLRRRAGAPVAVVGLAAALPAAAVAGVALANGVGASGVEWLRGVGVRVPWLLLRSWSGRSALLAAATLALVVLGLRARGRARVVGACWVAVPVAVVTAGEMLRPLFVDRYLLPAAVGLTVLAGGGAASLRRGAAVVTAGALAASLGATATDLARPPRDDVRTAVRAVAARHRPGEPVVAAARWDALGVDHYVRRDQPALRPDLVLAPPAPAAVPAGRVVWVVRRARGGVKGDQVRLEALERDLAGRGMAVSDERRFEGRYADVLVQRWVAAQATVRTD